MSIIYCCCTLNHSQTHAAIGELYVCVCVYTQPFDNAKPVPSRLADWLNQVCDSCKIYFDKFCFVFFAYNAKLQYSS